MLGALASADAVTWVSIVVKALAYAATLGAVGSVLVIALLRDLSESGRVALRRTASLSAFAAAIFTMLRLPLRASFLMGSTWDGALDPMILGMVADSPLGTSIAVRLAGLALILCVLLRGHAGLWLACLGALLASISFALRGHALGEPQALLGALITLHILCLAFWVGAFAPLRGSAQISNATLQPVIYKHSQRRVVVVGGHGGSEDQSWKHQTYQPFAHFALLGTRGASSAKSDH